MDRRRTLKERARNALNRRLMELAADADEDGMAVLCEAFADLNPETPEPDFDRSAMASVTEIGDTPIVGLEDGSRFPIVGLPRDRRPPSIPPRR